MKNTTQRNLFLPLNYAQNFTKDFSQGYTAAVLREVTEKYKISIPPIRREAMEKSESGPITLKPRTLIYF